MGRSPKLEAMEQLRQEYASCTSCYLDKYRTQVVFGGGDLDAKLLVIGEGPGKQEDRQGETWVGVSGLCLNAALAECGLGRAEVWTTNRVLCIPKTAHGSVESPGAGPLLACMHRLLSEIYIVDPRVILTLGKTAIQMLTGASNLKMGTAAGKQFSLKFDGNMLPVEYPAIATWHPSYLLRNGELSVGADGKSTEVTGPVGKEWLQHIQHAVRLANLPRSFAA